MLKEEDLMGIGDHTSMNVLKENMKEVEDFTFEMVLVIAELTCFEYAITAMTPKNKKGGNLLDPTILYFVSHYHHEGVDVLMEKIKPINPKIKIEIVERMIKGFLRGQRFTQLKVMK